MRGLKNKSRKLLTFIIACVMVLSVITVSATVYNNYSKADTLQESVIDTAVDDELDEDIDESSTEYGELADEEDQIEASDEVAADSVEEDDEVNYIDPKEVRFMQSSIKNKTGEHTVLNNAKALKDGTLKPTDMPLIKLWKDDDGNIWTLDHRRLAAFRLAGLDSVPFEWATEEEVEKQMWKMTTTTQGKTIRLKLGDGKNMTVK